MNDPCRARFPDLPKVEETLGPEYVALMDWLQDIDPEEKSESTAFQVGTKP
jgi:hypothetical protein